MVKGIIEVKPIIEKKGKDVIIHVPSMALIHKLKQDGIRNIQPIQSKLNE